MKKQVETIRKISIFRILLALIASGLLVYFSYSTWEVQKEQSKFVVDFKSWFAPYVDVTAKPTYSFEQINNTNNNVVLAFIVSSKNDACVPTWGTYYTLDEAANQLDLDRRIARLRQQKGDIAVSFGGAINDELSLNCTDEDKLLNAYKSVVDKYAVTTIDLDLENNGLTNKDAGLRRAKVLSKLQSAIRGEGKILDIWLTLPVTPQGLTTDGTDAIATLLSNGVDITGVNIMTMDYGQSKNAELSMSEASINALNETHRQLGILYKQNNITLSAKTLWKKLGATPMIGQNDIKEEIFDLEDAKKLNAFALQNDLGRLSMWSANRDIQCGENYIDTKVVSDSCSGIKQIKNEFSKYLSAELIGMINQGNLNITTKEDISSTVVLDDPTNSPYQIWRPEGVYPKGVKVVWKKNVYEAKWWTKNDAPDNPVLQYWETPWKLLGPVLPGEKPLKQVTLPLYTYPNWSGTKIYQGGERVLFEGIPFQSKWWNQGESPAVSAVNPDSSPWLPLTQSQIEEILKTKKR